MNAAARLETLPTAEKLLPWDAQLALSKSRAYASMGLDHLEEALREARRALRIAPYRMPTYHRISNYFRAQGRLDSALQQLEQGLKQAPNEPVLLYALAEVQQELGLRREALRTYEKLVKVEASPVGQVRALAEYLEWRFARAHMALASSLERIDPEAAFQHRKAAACLLAQRRLIFNGSPAVYLVYDSLDEDLERALRADEERLWKTLVGDYRRQGETHLADLAREQVEQVDTGRERMEQLFNELRGESF
jgi:tetratricopeptide (TPR) repeat protein